MDETVLSLTATGQHRACTLNGTVLLMELPSLLRTQLTLHYIIIIIIGRFGDRISVRVRFSTPVETGTGTHPVPVKWVPVL